jgi:hypothetical protein
MADRAYGTGSFAINGSFIKLFMSVIYSRLLDSRNSFATASTSLFSTSIL